MSEQAESSALESNDLVGLASFLSDTPETESEQEENEAQEPQEESTGEEADPETEANDDSTEEDAAEDADEAEDADAEEATTAERKIKVPERHPDGTVTEIEITEKELIAGYERQASYTRKTQALAERESQAVEFLKTKHDEVRSHYLQQAEVNRAAIVEMAGIKTAEEMDLLSQSDPAQWVAETNRQQRISNFLAGLDNKIKAEKQAAEQEAAQRQQMATKQQYERAWTELKKDGIDKPALAKIYEGANKLYGFSADELNTVYDPRMVRVLKDAAAYQALKAQKPAVTAKVTAAPKLPTRQASPAQERQAQAVENKFRSGKAKLNDLAALLR